jgi:hypothetical protein
MQSRLASLSPALRPNEDGLAAHAELSGNRGKRLPALQSGKSGSRRSSIALASRRERAVLSAIGRLYHKT